MSSRIFSAASAILALSGVVSAFPQANFANTTASSSGNNTITPSNSTISGSLAGNSTSPYGNSTLSESLFCPGLNAQVYADARGFEYIIECNTNHFGVVIDVAVSVAKRQAALRPASLGDCLTICDGEAACVGTAFDTVARTCTLFSSVGAAYNDANAAFAVRIAGGAATSVSAGAAMTSTVFSTNVVTISSCAPTVTNCPLKGAVVTQVVPVSSSVYICPSATLVPAAPVACACAYSASTATIYSATVVNGVHTVVQAGSSVVAVPYPTGTTVSTTTVACSSCSAGAATSSAAATTATASTLTKTCAGGCSASATVSSKIVAYTGAAGHLKAGMGMMAVVAGAAAML